MFFVAVLAIFIVPFVLGSRERDIGGVPFLVRTLPKELEEIHEGEARSVNFEISVESDNGTILQQLNSVFVTLESENSKILQVLNSSFCIWDPYDSTNVTFSVRGVLLGYSQVKLSVYNQCDDDVFSASLWSEEMSAVVVRVPSKIEKIAMLILAVVIGLNFINMGVQLDMEVVKDTIRRPIGPAIGFLCQFLFMPLASFGLGYLLLDNRSLRLGLFVLGCSPGGSMSNFWTLLFGGDLNLSVTMTFISTLAALGMMPMWLFTLGAQLFGHQRATIPYQKIIISLAALTLPLAIGLLIKSKSPRLTRFSRLTIRPFTIITVSVAGCVTFYAYRFLFSLITWQVVLAVIGVSWGGYCFGALVSLAFRLETPQVIAVSIETAMQSATVAFILLLINLPQPDADLSTTPVLAQALVASLPVWILFIVSWSYRWIKKKLCDRDSEQTEEKTNGGYIAVTASPSADEMQVWVINENKIEIVNI